MGREKFGWLRQPSPEEKTIKRLVNTKYDSYYCYQGDISTGRCFDQRVEIRFVKDYQEFERKISDYTDRITKTELKYREREVSYKKRERVNLKDLGVEGGWEPSVGGAVLGGLVAGVPGAIFGGVFFGGNTSEAVRVTDATYVRKLPFLLVRTTKGMLVSYTMQGFDLSSHEWQKVQLEKIQEAIDEAKQHGLVPVLRVR